ncbi:MAG: energy transducer TonB [Fulvivirga sp.]|nr:energy transducer TonB [Fulvivirga sp.]
MKTLNKNSAYSFLLCIICIIPAIISCNRTSKEDLEEDTALFHNNESYEEEIREIAKKYPNLSYTYIPSDSGSIKTIKGRYTVAVDAVDNEEDENKYIKYLEKRFDARIQKRNLLNQHVDQGARPKNGYPELFRVLEANTQMPEEARERDLGGTVFVEFIVEPDSSLSNIEVSESIYFTADFAVQEAFDEQAIKAVEATEGHWLPATQNDEPTAMKLEIPVTFPPNQGA